VGSCTTPLNGFPVDASISVGAIRAASDAAGLNVVSAIPSGSKICSRAN
jgi:hypothetical protein